MKKVFNLLAACLTLCLVACGDPNPPIDNPDKDLPAYLSKDKKSEMTIFVGVKPVTKDTTIVLDTPQFDRLDEVDFFEFKGNVENVDGFRVSVKRSSKGLNDQFCAGTCLMGNGELTQDFDFPMTGTTSTGYYAHFYPTATQKAEQIAYTFRNHDRAITITVKYEYNK